MTFRVGMKVVCVDVRIPIISRILRWTFDYPWPLRVGEVYTIEKVSTFQGAAIVTLVEVKNPPQPENAFWARRFRPAVERKTSIEIFTRMLNPSKVDA